MNMLSVGVVILVITFIVVLDDDFKRDDILSSAKALISIAIGLAMFLLGCGALCIDLIRGILP